MSRSGIRGRVVLVEISKFVHSFDLGEHVALWHALRMKPVFLTKKTYKDLLDGSCADDVRQELKHNKIILSYEGEDEDVLKWVRSKVPSPSISICYFILSERCNLACKYCFLGNNSEKRKLFSSTDMSREVADKAIDFFVRQLLLSGIDFKKNASQIIFFGGEPLINFDILEYVAHRINALRTEIPVLASCEMSVITNGTLLTKERIIKLNNLGVTVNISIDGSTSEANQMRVDVAGNEVFERLIAILDLFKDMHIKPSLSVSLTDSTIKDLPGLLDLINKYDIKGLGYNILLCSDNFTLPDQYYKEASDFIIDSFKVFRPLGIYEDRIMRKLNAFAHSQIHFSDCGATAGGQLVFSPDGRVGICHEMLAEKENFVTTVFDESFNAKEHPLWQKWANLTPINCDDCISCEALGICGGGCPVNARLRNPDKGLHVLDERSCIHAKSTLKFLIEDLYQVAINRIHS
ncbi:MAG: FibroRumin system radical SAM peptide maturase [Prolixibacteraceae bacterium]|nr:FibroRumin system radical SAM peptide maturase [Prolixibacteraceae bacterium]